jgi:hypothetical protein
LYKPSLCDIVTYKSVIINLQLFAWFHRTVTISFKINQNYRFSQIHLRIHASPAALCCVNYTVNVTWFRYLYWLALFRSFDMCGLVYLYQLIFVYALAVTCRSQFLCVRFTNSRINNNKNTKHIHWLLLYRKLTSNNIRYFDQNKIWEYIFPHFATPSPLPTKCVYYPFVNCGGRNIELFEMSLVDR